MVCSICHESLTKLAASGFTGTNSTNRLRPAALNCGHVFHKLCIDRWFSSSTHRTCPLCHKEHNGSAIVLFIETDESDDAEGSERKRPHASASSSSTQSSSLVGQSMDVDKLCECFEELGLDVPGLDNYRGYQDYCDVLLDELVASTALMVSKNDDDKGKLHSRISDLEDDLKESKDLCKVHENEITRLTRLSVAHRTHIAGLQESLRKNKTILAIYERRYGSSSGFGM